MAGFKTQVYKFWTVYRQDPTDDAKLVGIDFVEFGPPGMGDRTRAVEKVSRILKVRERDPNDMNEAIAQANDFADYIRPLYEAWKKGQDIPDTGTPLAAWNALTPELAEVFRMRAIRTVEDIAELTESGMSRVPVPNIRKLVQQAKLFLEARDQTRVAGDLARKDEEIALLRAEMQELQRLFKANDKTGEPEPIAASPAPTLPPDPLDIPPALRRGPPGKAA